MSSLKSYSRMCKRRYEVSPWLTADDIEALCNEAIWDAEKTYSWQRGITLQVWTKMKIRWILAKPFQDALALKARHFPFELVDDDEDDSREIFEASSLNPSTQLHELHLDVQRAIGDVLEGADPIDRAIVAEHVLGVQEMSELATKLGITKQAIWLRRNRLFATLRVLLEDYKYDQETRQV